MPLPRRAIIQCSIEGVDLRRFSCVQEAAEALGIVNKGHIYKAIKYGLVSLGYRWRYEDSPLIEAQHYDMRLKKVIASKDGIDTEYPSIVQASIETGATVSHIQQAILTGGVAKGYRFRLEGASEKPIAKRAPKVKTVVAIDEQGNVLKQWGSAYECATDLGVIPAAVYRCLSPKNEKARCKGYLLRYR